MNKESNTGEMNRWIHVKECACEVQRLFIFGKVFS